MINTVISSFYGLVAAEISRFSNYFDSVYELGSVNSTKEQLFSRVECSKKYFIAKQDDLPNFRIEKEKRTLILLNGNFNHSLDIEELLASIKLKMNRFCRVAVVVYQPYYEFLFRLLNFLGFRKGALPVTFFTSHDLRNLCRLTGFEVVQEKRCGLIPFHNFTVIRFIERLLLLIPGFRTLAFVSVLVFRPIIKEPDESPSLSIIIPARNEKGNIASAITRLPNLGCVTEVIFIEGHSKDGTWEEIQRVIELHRGSSIRIRAFQQTGTGKNDAVRLGFSKATSDVLTILDADLTMPPELLGRFYNAYRDGKGDFINGSRLLYPMEGNAMRFLNRLGNIFFAKALSGALGTPITDSLCGTKLLSRYDYARFTEWRLNFGDFDPFGDFELLFPASVLGVGIIDIPVRYRARTYGETNISRFRHGWMLLKMTARAFQEFQLLPCAIKSADTTRLPSESRDAA